MITALSVGDRIHVGDSVTLMLLGVEGDLIEFGIESSEAGSNAPSVVIEERKGPGRNWWELN